jgi:glycosyltransferase involved in cell wall biosynthesis
VDRLAETLRTRLETRNERRLLEQVRDGRPLCWREEAEPLVTVRIATYNRGALLAERALASAARQTYERLEILVVGDCCDDATRTAVESFDDPRVRFVNLPTRGLYPPGPTARRKVAGAHPMNAALYLARGSWLAPLDDDDEFSDDHVEVLLRACEEGSFELVYSKALEEKTPGKWAEVGSYPPRVGEVVHGTLFYSTALRFIHHSGTCWQMGNQPGDWNLVMRMQRIGVRIGFVPEVTYRHYLGAGQREVLIA